MVIIKIGTDRWAKESGRPPGDITAFRLRAVRLGVCNTASFRAYCGNDLSRCAVPLNPRTGGRLFAGGKRIPIFGPACRQGGKAGTRPFTLYHKAHLGADSAPRSIGALQACRIGLVAPG